MATPQLAIFLANTPIRGTPRMTKGRKTQTKDWSTRQKYRPHLKGACILQLHSVTISQSTIASSPTSQKTKTTLSGASIREEIGSITTPIKKDTMVPLRLCLSTSKRAKNQKQQLSRNPFGCNAFLI